MCHKIRCDGKSCKVLGFGMYLNKALGCWYRAMTDLDMAAAEVENGWGPRRGNEEKYYIYFEL
jgi:hypothetical protein